MKKSELKLYNHYMKKLDIRDFCGHEDLEAISEDGLNFLMKDVSDMAQSGWQFVECARQESDPCLVHIHYRNVDKS